MDTRAYVLLDIVDGKADQAAETLCNKAGVRMVDVLEGSPNVIMIIQARNRQRLAELTNQALASVDNLTGGVQLLPTQNGRDKQMNQRKGSKLQHKRLDTRLTVTEGEPENTDTVS